jgi:putative ABC transport system permease protein
MLEQGKKMTLLGAHIAGRGVASGQLDKTLQGVGVGSDVNLELQGGNVVTLPVSGIFDNDFKQSDSRSLIGFDTAVAVAPQTANRPSTMYIKARDTQSVSELAEALETAYPDYQVQLGGESVGIDEQVGTINLINSILSIISLFVAAVMIFIVTYVDLNNRRRLIGIERAIGITAASIQLSYVIKTIVAAIIGIALGSVLYLLVLIPLSQTMPFRFPSGPVSLVPQHGLMLRYGGLLLLSAIVATLIPTWYTLRAKLVEVIWGR